MTDKKLSFEEIKDILKKNKVSGDQIADNYGIPKELGETESVDATPQNFDGDRFAVLHFKDHSVYIGVEGYDNSYEDSYDSYGGDGGDYVDWMNNFKEVRPTEKKVVEYVKQ
jgi:hypothetical protein